MTINIIYVIAKGFGQRHLQILLLFLCLTCVYTLRVNISVGIVAMTDKTSNFTPVIIKMPKSNHMSIYLINIFLHLAKIIRYIIGRKKRKV